jgi:hypothetical protein
MYGVLVTLKRWGINARTWLGAYLQACADNDNQAQADLSEFLPGAMNEAGLAAMYAIAPAVGALTEKFDRS